MMKRYIAVILAASLVLVSCGTMESNNLKTKAVSRNIETKTTHDSKDSKKELQTLRFLSFKMLDEKNGWAICREGIFSTSNSGIHWNDITPPKFKAVIDEGADDFDNNQYLFEYYADNMTAWVGKLYEGKKAVIYHTVDGGKHWPTSELNFDENWEGGHAFLDFINMKDGWLLVTSSPACGLMAKAVYRTADGGMHWEKISNASFEEKTTTLEALSGGYPSGIKFKNKNEGWVTYFSRGEEAILCKTTDGGKIWKPEELRIPDSVGKSQFGSTYPPVFSSDNDGILLTEIALVHNDRAILPFISQDGGHTWKAGSLLHNYSEQYYFEGNGLKMHIINTNDRCQYILIKGDVAWKKQDITLPGRIEDMEFKANYAWTIADGKFYISCDEGRTWD